jgi:hypothetical protein
MAPTEAQAKRKRWFKFKLFAVRFSPSRLTTQQQNIMAWFERIWPASERLLAQTT